MGESVNEQLEKETGIEQTCSLCGHEYKEDITVDEEDLQEFVRSLLGDRVFIKEYKLYNNAYTLTYRTLTSFESSRLAILLNKMIIEDIEDIYKKQKAVRLKLLFYLKSINGIEYSVPEDTDVDKVLTEYENRFGNKSENVISICVKTLVQFLLIQKMLIEHGYDENFWKSAGLR